MNERTTQPEQPQPDSPPPTGFWARVNWRALELMLFVAVALVLAGYQVMAQNGEPPGLPHNTNNDEFIWVRIAKYASPESDTDFLFECDGCVSPTSTTFMLTDELPGDVPAAQYHDISTTVSITISELTPADPYALWKIECYESLDGGNDGDFTQTLPTGVGQIIANSVVISPGASSNDKAYCLYFNAIPSVITITKEQSPAIGTNYSFTGTLGTFILDDAVVDDGDPYTEFMAFEGLFPGDYSVFENPANDLQSISCTANGQPVTYDNGQVSLPTITQGSVYSTSGSPDSTSTTCIPQIQRLSSSEQQGILEFDLTGIPLPPEAISAAHLILGIGFRSIQTPPLTVHVYGYSGNGTLDLADFDAGTMIASTTFSDEVQISIPVGEFVTGLLGSDMYAGFNLRIPVEDQGSIFSLVCDSAMLVVESTWGVKIPVDVNQTYACTFHNEPPLDDLLIVKSVTGDAPATDWEFLIESQSFGITQVVTIPAAGGAVTVPLPSGLYTVTETTKPGYEPFASCSLQPGALINGPSDYDTVYVGDGPAECYFDNFDIPILTIVKDTIPDLPDPFDFEIFYIETTDDITLIDDGTGLSNTHVISAFNGITYWIEEIPHPAFGTSTRCSDDEGNPFGSTGDYTATVTLDYGDNVTCTFTNKLNTITVIKEAFPEGDQPFPFEVEQTQTIDNVVAFGDFPINFDLIDDGTTLSNSKTITRLYNFNTYSITEQIPAGWSLTNIMCVDAIGEPAGITGANQAAITIQPGGMYTCTFTNELPLLTIEKRVVGVAPDDDWNFDIDGAGGADGSVAISATGGSISIPLPIDVYTITEETKVGYDVEVACYSDPPVSSAQVMVDLEVDATCVFTNTAQPATLIITKTVQGQTPGSVWNFNGSGSIGAFDLPAAGGSTNYSLNAGAYTVSETIKSGYMASVSCTDGTNSSSEVTVDLEPGETVGCEFTNVAQPATLIITKTVVGQTPDAVWDFSGTDPIGTFDLPAAGGSTDFTLDAGNYSVEETTKMGYMASVSCTDSTNGSNSVDLDLDPGETVGCEFTNTAQPATLIITKTVGGQTPDTVWDFSGTDPIGSFDLPATGGSTQFTLDAGSYSVNETTKPGYTALLAICTNGAVGSDSVNVTLAPGETVECEFINIADPATLIITKTLVGQVPDSDWPFFGTGSIGFFNLNAGGGSTQFSLDAGSYGVDETPKDGYMASVVCTDNTIGATSVTVDLDPGEMVGCEFTNQGMPNIQIEKTPDLQTVENSGIATWTIVVSNTGYIDLLDVHVTDPEAPNCELVVGTLAVGQQFSYQCNKTNVTAGFTNIALVLGHDGNGNNVSDEDDAEVNVSFGPDIEIVKTVYVGHDGGSSCPGAKEVTVDPDTALTYCFQVTNTGNTHLANVTVTDPDLGINLPVGTLMAPNQSETVFVEVTSSGSLANTATATGNPTDAQGEDLPNVDNPTDSDSAVVNQVTPQNPAIVLTKTVGTSPAVCSDTGTISVMEDSTVYYCYTVENVGNVTFTHHDLVDDQLGVILNDFAFVLAPGARTNTVAAGLVVSDTADVTITNVATWTAFIPAEEVAASAVDQLGQGVSAQGTDDATVNVIAANPNLTLIKTVGTDPATCAQTPSLQVEVGTAVYFCITARNTGNVTLTQHTLVDSSLGVTASFAYVLGPGDELQITNSVLESFGEEPLLGPVTASENLENTAVFEGSDGTVVIPVVAAADVLVTPTGLDQTEQPAPEQSRTLFLPTIAAE